MLRPRSGPLNQTVASRSEGYARIRDWPENFQLPRNQTHDNHRAAGPSGLNAVTHS
jgi:hypothetical protein